jgi:hypothetical protein
MRAAIFFGALFTACGDDAAPIDAGRDASVIDAADSAIAEAGSDGGAPDLAWPNAIAPATSDPWIVENHDAITVMRPRVLALNFVNARTNDDMLALMNRITAAIREGSRPRGYEDASSSPFLEYDIAYAIDLRDETPPDGWPYRNSTIYPREERPMGYWGFDYGRLFTEEFAANYGIEDPEAPGTYLDLCELSARGLVHEVWIYGDADVPDVSAAEILGIQPVYDDSMQPIPGMMNRCAGNGCFDSDDFIPPACSRTLRVGWVNNTRGVGCYLESISHGIEHIGRSDDIPYFTPLFSELAGFDLRARYGVTFDSWYDVCDGPTCLSFPSESSVEYRGRPGVGTIDPYVPVCGNAHFPPNAQNHYDIENAMPVLSTCRHWRTGAGASDPQTPTSAADWSRYRELAPDCTGAWIVWWWQNFPGRDTRARDDDGAPVKSFWPFLFY